MHKFHELNNQYIKSFVNKNQDAESSTNKIESARNDFNK